MRDELLAYLLNDLDDEQRGRIEERLEMDPIWQHELNRLRSYVEEAHQSSSAESDALPEDLVHRTCSFVKQASSQGALSPAVLPATLSESQDEAPPKSKHWSLLDLAVVASILLVLGTLLLPALRESRDAARRLQCQEKLRALGFALSFYAEQTNGQLPAIDRHENAGMYAIKLVESGVLTSEQLVELIVCPSTQLAEDIHRGVIETRIPTRLDLANAAPAALKSLFERMGGSFAYRVGYVDQQGQYRQVEFVGHNSAPMMADKPSFAVAGFQSATHGCGQNVLFQDRSVRYMQVCMQDGRDSNWFLNEDGQPAAGKHELDIVMIRSEATPSGLLAMDEKFRAGK